MSPLSANFRPTVPCSGVLMTQHFHLSTSTSPDSWPLRKLKKYLFEMLLRRASHALFSIDPLLVDQYSGNHQKLRLLRDPSSFTVNVSNDSTSLIESEGRFNVLLYGSISLRKGLAQLLEAAISDSLKDKIRITIAGRQDIHARQYLFRFLQRHPQAASLLEIRDEYIAPNAEIDLFLQSNVVWVGYANFYSMSGVLVQAGMCRRPVLASHDGIIGEMTKKYELGVAVNIHDNDAVVRGLLQLQEELKSQRYGSNGHQRFKDHTVDNFKKSIADLIDSMLEKPVPAQ